MLQDFAKDFETADSAKKVSVSCVHCVQEVAAEFSDTSTWLAGSAADALLPLLLFAVCKQVVKLKAFSKFENTTEALAAATALVESKLSKGATVLEQFFLCCQHSMQFWGLTAAAATRRVSAEGQ